MMTAMPDNSETFTHQKRLWEEGNWEALIPLTRDAVAAARRVQDQMKEADGLLELTLLLVFTGRCQAAAEVARQELKVRRQLGDPSWTAAALSSLGMALEEAGMVKPALLRYRQALFAFRQLGETIEVCNQLATIGHLLHVQGHCKGALKAFEEALPLASDVQHFWDRATILNALADTHKALRNLPAASRCLFESAQELHRLGKESTEVLFGIARLHLGMDQTWEAQELIRIGTDQLRDSGRLDEAKAVEERFGVPALGRATKRFRLATPVLKAHRC